MGGVLLLDALRGRRVRRWLPRFPGRLPRRGGQHPAHPRIKYAEQPSSVSLLTSSKVDERGERYVKRPRPLATTLKPVLQEGQTVAWDAFFGVKRPDRHYYLTFSANWGDGRDASWDFHVQTRKDT
jgi:hypothetical protein